MKAKVKILSGAMAAMLLVPCGANAASATDVVKKLCVQKSDFVWDDTNKVCIYQNACDSGKDTNDGRYCVKAFKNTQVNNLDDAKRLAYIYAKRKLGSATGCSWGWSDANNTFGQDYIGCHLKNGGYVTFEFDDTNNSDMFTNGNENYDEYHVCTDIYSGSVNNQTVCSGIETQTQCKQFQEDIVYIYKNIGASQYIDESKVGRADTWDSKQYACQYPWADSVNTGTVKINSMSIGEYLLK